MRPNEKQRIARTRVEASYYARITKQRGGGYLVEFPDLPGCLTEGNNVKTARANAREALSAWLFVALEMTMRFLSVGFAMAVPIALSSPTWMSEFRWRSGLAASARGSHGSR